LPRVLVVDEQANQARMIAIGLRLEGFDVETAASSAEALTRLGELAFDVAIVDLMLPGTNGIQLARVVRDRHPATRVVLMSAYHLSEQQLARADCGAAGFVPKPLDLGELAAFLRSKAGGGPGTFGMPGGDNQPGARGDGHQGNRGDSRPGSRARSVAGASAAR
jgi:DNA-binding response OmpR family regulator